MRQVSLITLVSLVALFTGGCMGGDEEQQATQPSPAPKTAVPIKPRKPAPAASPFQDKPLVTQQPANTTVAGLIQPELPDNAVKRVPQGQRNDPFSTVPMQPTVTVSPNTPLGLGNGKRPVPQVPSLPSAKPAPVITKLPLFPKATKEAPSSTSKRNSTAPGNLTAPNRSSTATAKLFPPSKASPLPAIASRTIPELPKLPEPTQARGVEVTGVVEVGGVPMAIVKVPNEPARYVREGQRIANGQVLVKRIETNRGPNPVVILEQYGVEVARGVGEAPATSPAGPGQASLPPTASLPSTHPSSHSIALPQA